MKKAIYAAVTAFPLLLGACANQVPPLNFSVPDVGPSQTKLNAEVKSMTVTLARPDERTGELPAGAVVVPPLWKTALEEALDHMVIFRDDSARKVSISVKVLKMDIPTAGVSFTTTAAARYEIIDRNNGDVIFTQDVETTGTTPGDYAFLGLARQRESINRAVQNNISRFLQALETVDLSKPMFPANAQHQVPSPAPTSAVKPASAPSS